MNDIEVVYERRPFLGTYDSTTQTLIEIMNSVALETESSWSFAGGFARDLYLKQPWNDYDICIYNHDFARNLMTKSFFIEKGVQSEDVIEHDYFLDPYDFSSKKYPLHWIEADTKWAFAPAHFDFSINHICLKPDGYFHAPTYAWRDFDRKIFRLKAPEMTGNMAMRAVRFASKLDYSLADELREQIITRIKEPISTMNLIRNAEKMIEDDVAEKSLLLMKELEFPETEQCETLEDYITIQNNLVLSGNGYREPTPARYG